MFIFKYILTLYLKFDNRIDEQKSTQNNGVFKYLSRYIRYVKFMVN